MAKKKDEAKVSDTPAEDLGVEAGKPVERPDRMDAGVEMLGGDPSEPQGPEDALGEGDKRGDYRDRQDGSRHLEARPIPGGGGPVVNEDGGIDNAPHTELVDQTARVEQIGDVAGKKGGVETAGE